MKDVIASGKTSKDVDCFFHTSLKNIVEFQSFQKKMPADHNTSRLPRWQGVKYQMSCCHERAIDDYDSFAMNGSTVFTPKKRANSHEFCHLLNPLLFVEFTGEFFLSLLI